MKKKIIIAALVLLLAVLLIPLRYQYKDGGSVEYKAVLYSVYKEHSMAIDPDCYNIGTVVTILGFEVYNDVQNNVPSPAVQ